MPIGLGVLASTVAHQSINRATGERIKSADYVNMIDEDGQPRLFTRTIMRRKLGTIAKGKAPGFSGNGPDLYASMPDQWLDWAVELANIIQYTQLMPHDWLAGTSPTSSFVTTFIREAQTAACQTTDRYRWSKYFGKL